MILDAPAVYESDRLEQCSTQADLAYPRLLGVADDWGRVEWNPRKILARAFPKRPAIREGDVRRWLLEYDRVRSPKDPQGPGLLRRYTVGAVEYLEWYAWKGVAPSKRHFMRCPPPPWADPAESAIWEKSRFYETAKRRGRHLKKEADGDSDGGVSDQTRQGTGIDGATDGQGTNDLPAGKGRFSSPQGVVGTSISSGENGNQKTVKAQAPESEMEPQLFRQVPAVPAVPAVNNDPPSPPTGGDGPDPVRESPAEKRIRLWWIAIGGHPDRNDRRHLREALFAGHPEEELRRQIAERVREDLIRAGRFDYDKPWPPEAA